MKSQNASTTKKKADLNFKKFLLALSSIGNLILGSLLVVMGVQAIRFNLSTIFIADKGLLVIGVIIVLYSFICIIGVLTDGVIVLLMVYFNAGLTMIFLSIFAMGAISMNPNIINWIDNHWDIIRTSVFTMDMNKFKSHVTTEINSLGIFSMTINATLCIKMACIQNLLGTLFNLGFKNIIIAISPLTNLIFSLMSTGLIMIGFYSQQHYHYTSITTWSSSLLIVLGFFLFVIGIFGYVAITKMNRRSIKFHIILLLISLVLLIVACVGFFSISATVPEYINKNWIAIQKVLHEKGYMLRKSFLVNQIQVNLKFAGFFTSVFVVFVMISFSTSLYQHSLF